MAVISVLLLTSDEEYSGRLMGYMAERHQDIKICVINSSEKLKEVLAVNFFSVILLDDRYMTQELALPDKVGIVYLTDRDKGDIENEKRIFCKYRSGEMIYRMILGVYSEYSGIVKTVSDDTLKTYAFFGAGGGLGSTTVSAALAKNLASEGKSVLYLSFDRYSVMSLLFDGDENVNLSELLFAILAAKKTTTNLSAKAASLLTTDSSGVSYINECKSVLDYFEMSEERIRKIISSLTAAKKFDVVVLDGNCLDNSYRDYIERCADKIFILTANNNVANAKLKRFIDEMKIKDSRNKENSNPSIPRLGIIMNRDMTRSWTGSVFEGVKFAGSVPRYSDSSVKGIVNAAALLDFWAPAINM